MSRTAACPAALTAIFLALTPGSSIAVQEGLADALQGEELESRLVGVTVYGTRAAVRRTVVVPPGGGEWIIRGLPRSMDPDSVRVRFDGGEVVGVESRERFQTVVPSERVQTLRLRLVEMEYAHAAIRDEADVLKRLERHLDRLFAQEEQGHAGDVQTGRADPAAWEANFQFLAAKLAEVKRQYREVGVRMTRSAAAIQDLKLELGRFESSGAVRLYDLLVDLLDDAGRGGILEVDYLVSNAGWEAVYDLRTEASLSEVELVYRARIWQRTGEDWSDVDLVLSTARPNRGAQGPEPSPQWLDLLDPNKPSARWAGGELRSLGYVENEADALGVEPVAEASGAPVTAFRKAFAQVSSSGLSVQFRIPRKETIESRDLPTTVLVGRASLEVEPERYCVPAVDTTVWLRAKTTNSSPWAMLPGRASVFLGGDFIGQSMIGAVQVGEDLTLSLGPDPMVTVERIQLEDLTKKPRLFRSKQIQRESFKLVLQNHGAAGAGPDGAVSVIVHEVLPRARDSRIQVEMDGVSPALATGERWDKEREEKGIQTWVLPLKEGKKAEIRFSIEILFPEGKVLQRQ